MIPHAIYVFWNPFFGWAGTALLIGGALLLTSKRRAGWAMFLVGNACMLLQNGVSSDAGALPNWPVFALNLAMAIINARGFFTWSKENAQ